MIRDEMLVRMIEEASKSLSQVDGYQNCSLLVGSYNALLQAAKANHPNDPFLSALERLDKEEDDVTVAVMRVLLGQMRIALESLSGSGMPGSAPALAEAR
jgi:hypothetical protein